MQEPAQNIAPLAEEAEGLSLAQDLRRLAEEAKTLAQAELAFQKSRAAYAGSESKTITLLMLLAAVFVFFALMALVTGTVIALGTLIGPWGAMAVVTLALLLIAGACLLSAKSRVTRMMAVISDGQK